ncbi:MAG: HAMP domain-containing histidine kinase [Oscillospiraceae bacterium]|nr:HAMP domain-containing histidine kinase [Oscillospiraceae bacterium]
MSARNRLISGSLTAVFIICAVNLAVCFALFWFIAAPYLGERLTVNGTHIAARYFLLGGFIAFVLTGCGAMWILSLTVRHVAAPMKKLKRAAQEIRDGNLDYELVVTGHDEFTELGLGFEQMRIRLKDSMHLQRKAEDSRLAMMASITHDLKTPITSIMGYADGILDGVADTPDKLYEYAAVIRKKARSLQLLADDLSLLSRLENAQLPLDRFDTDMGEFAAELLYEFSAECPGLAPESSLPPGLKVSVDREKMARVLYNLFQNSVKYKKPEQSVPILRLSLAQNGSDALLTVSDEGIGIARNDLGNVFEQFYRADTSRGQSSGSGLGLSIARELVQLHGGKIWIVNNHGGGISVNIALPLVML